MPPSPPWSKPPGTRRKPAFGNCSPHTRRAHGRTIGEFLAWCEQRGVGSIADVQSLHVGAYVELLTRTHSAPTAKRRMAAIRLARHRADRADEFGREHARAEAGRQSRQEACARLAEAANAYAMIRWRGLAGCTATKIGNHSFHATGVTAYLKNGDTLEKAAAMANHASTRTTQLYDRRHGRD